MTDEEMGIVAKYGDRGAAVRVVQRLLHLKVDGIFGPLTEEAVKEFQRANALTADGIVGRKTWPRLLGLVLLPSKRLITELIIHCTATPSGRDVTVEEIRSWHLARGFSDIGYHYVIYLDGSIHEGRDVNIAGAHCAGHNTHSIGICYVGGLTKDGAAADTRTPAQEEAMLSLLRLLKDKYPYASIHGHRDYANKACPCFDATKEYCNL